MGFGMGVYVGTKYDCKPTIIFMKDCFKKFVPDESIPKKKDNKHMRKDYHNMLQTLFSYDRISIKIKNF